MQKDWLLDQTLVRFDPNIYEMIGSNRASLVINYLRENRLNSNRIYLN